MPKSKPTELIIRSYQVGFGDCFLLTFRYPAKNGKPDDRHVLIDCGSTGMPKTMSSSLRDVATEIANDCARKLTAVIATHRHADHINGFATKDDKKGSGDILRSLKPDLVVQPWTEDPKAPRDAKAPKASRNNGRPPTRRSFVASLQNMHQFSGAILEEVKRLGSSLPKRLRDQLTFLGEQNLKNASAVKNLMTMGKVNEYLHYRKPTRLEKLLPGVKIHVLGPPTPEQYPEVEKQRSSDSEEFWHLLGAAAGQVAAMSGHAPFHQSYAASASPPHVRWFVQRVKAAHAEQRLEIVRALDDAMNNTSLILLFEIGRKKFLFPGDAQIENWNYALKDSPEAKRNQKLLSQTDFYKVGHHGSLNATPKTLWNLFKKKGRAAASNRLMTVVSTMSGKHGSSTRQTEVPRRPLITELENNSVFFTTQKLKRKLSDEIRVKV